MDLSMCRWSASAKDLAEWEAEAMRTRMQTVIVRDVKGEQRTFMVSTCNTFDAGWETMVFACEPDGRITEWGNLYCARYEDQTAAAAGHEITAQSWVPPEKSPWEIE